MSTPSTDATTSAPSTSPPPTDDLYTAWTRVAVCEEGGWVGSSGNAYPNSLGINAANWWANGGTATDLSPAAQIAVAQRVNGNGPVPDQHGCAPW